ncbi:MAG: aspartate-semialdehyde dehydrogenase [Elusimicrobiales bacterium]|nr:aspartate-semialdehyde dehydrogenase [Elusimicrobiales bacterium]
MSNKPKKSQKYNIAVVGASGMVGSHLLFLLEKRKFPLGEVKLFNSGKEKTAINFLNKKYICKAPTLKELKKSDIVFFVSSEKVSERFAKKLSAAGICCIDETSQFRLDKNIPLIIPEINAKAIGLKKLISGPNCSLTGAAVALHEVHKEFKIRELRISTYQAVSGAGKAAIEQFNKELKAYCKTGKTPDIKSKVFPRAIALNLFPEVGAFDKDGHSSEENKIELELKKIWKTPALRVSSTTVRVPVLRGHALSVWVKTDKEWTIKKIEKLLLKTKGLKYFKNPYNYPTPLDAPKNLEVMASRLRKSKISTKEFQIWIVSDNLYKGAALNTVQIAEHIIKK